MVRCETRVTQFASPVAALRVRFVLLLSNLSPVRFDPGFIRGQESKGLETLRLPAEDEVREAESWSSDSRGERCARDGFLRVERPGVGGGTE